MCPPIHGAKIAGRQGIGVSVPMAAAVADATVGLESEEHIPKGGILTMGLKSMMDAIGLFASMTCLSGNTTSLDGAKPKVHFMVADVVTNEGIRLDD